MKDRMDLICQRQRRFFAAADGELPDALGGDADKVILAAAGLLAGHKGDRACVDYEF